MKMKMYGHMNSPSKKRNSVLTKIIKKFRKPSPPVSKTRFNTLPSEMMIKIAEKMSNKNVESLFKTNERVKPVHVTRQIQGQLLRSLEKKILREHGGHPSKKYKETIQEMKRVNPNHQITLMWESHLMNTERLLKNLKYSHPDPNGNVYKEMVRRKVMRRGRRVFRTLPRYYILNSRGALSMMNTSRGFPIFRRIAVNVVPASGGSLKINNGTINQNIVLPRNIRWVGPFAHTNNNTRHFMTINGKYKYYPKSDLLKFNNKTFTNASKKFNRLPHS